MKHFSLEMYRSIRHDLTLEGRKELMAGYDNVIRFQGNSETRETTHHLSRAVTIRAVYRALT